MDNKPTYLKNLLDPKLVISSVLFIVAFYSFAPGFMSYDSIDQYGQAVSGNYNSWHPPIMAALWRLLNYVSAPSGMLAFHLALYWSGWYLLSKLAEPRLKNWSFLIVLIGLLPCTLSISGIIWKDVGLGVTWLNAACLLAFIHKSGGKNKFLHFTFILLLFYGFCVRSNSIFAFLPLAASYVYSFSITAKRKILFFFFFSFSFLIAKAVLNEAVLDTKKTQPLRLIQIHDIAAIFVGTKNNYFPQQIKDNTDDLESLILKGYKPELAPNIFWVPGRMLYSTPQKIELDALKAHSPQYDRDLTNAWLEAITNHPLTYIKHRLLSFDGLMRVYKKTSSHGIYYYGIIDNEYGVEFAPNKGTEFYYTYIKIFSHWPFFKGWFWLVLSICVFLYALKTKPVSKSSRLSIVLSSSSLLYTMPYLFFGIAPDFRYLYWSILATITSMIFLLIEKSHD